MSRSSNSFFQFKQFRIDQDKTAMKVTTDACILGGLVSSELSPKTILDIGAGTGLLSLMMAQKFPEALIQAVEIDQSAYLQARKNIENSFWKDRIRLFNTPIQEWVSKESFDLIVCNPPFFHRSLTSPDLQINLARHGDSLSQEDLVQELEKRLAPDGTVYVLYPEAEGISFSASLKNLSVNEVIGIYNHPKDVDRNVFRQVRRLSFDKRTVEERTFCIRNNNKEYTDSFTELLSDYYLYL